MRWLQRHGEVRGMLCYLCVLWVILCPGWSVPSYGRSLDKIYYLASPTSDLYMSIKPCNSEYNFPLKAPYLPRGKPCTDSDHPNALPINSIFRYAVTRRKKKEENPPPHDTHSLTHCLGRYLTPVRGHLEVAVDGVGSYLPPSARPLTQ